MPNYRTKLSSSSGDQPARAKLFGIGSAGCNMIEGAPFPTVAFSTSSADIARSHADRKVLIGQDRLVGAADAGPDLIKKLPSVIGHELFDVFNNTELAFMMCGLGGTTGSLGSKMFCSIAKAKGATSLVFAAMPFSAESIRRREMASRTVKDLVGLSSLCVVFDNDKLSSLAPNLALSRAFGLLNNIMTRPVVDLCATVSRNDIPVIRTVVGDAVYSRFGLGMARGDDRVQRTVSEALSSPWFDFDLKEVTACVAIYSSADPWDKEISSMLGALEERLPSASVLWGSYADAKLGERIRLSLLVCRRL
jgi:cell division protein FtsZ